MKLPATRGARLVVAACVVVGVGVLAAVVQASIPDGNGVIHGCYQTHDATHNGGTQLRILDSGSNASCNKDETAIQWNQTGPTGATGQQGATGPTGPAGTGPTSESCSAGSFVTGFDGSGNIICSCPHTGYHFTITAVSAQTLQFWPVQTLTDTNATDSACSVTVQTPFSTALCPNGGRCSESIGGGFSDTGWSFVSSTGYPTGTTFSIQVNNPNCKTVGGVGSVSNNFPICSNASDAFSSGESTDEAIFTPN